MSGDGGDGAVTRRSRKLSWLVVVALAATAASVSPAQAPAEPDVKHVLIVQSFGSDFAPFSVLSSSFRTGLAQKWPGQVAFHEVSLEISHPGSEATEGPFIAYVRALVEDCHPDLAVLIGGPASRFGLVHREGLFPTTPVLIAGTDLRLIPGALLSAEVATAATAQRPSRVVETILRVLPETETVAVILGSSDLERFWKAELEREFRPLEGRLRFEWWEEKSLDEMAARAAVLPPRSALLYVLLLADGAGVPHASDRALRRLRAATNAPIFGLFDIDLGNGVVGGPLISVAEGSRRSVEAAVAMLHGAAPSSLRLPPVRPGAPVFDWRELRRWGIAERSLPPGSTAQFKPPSIWSVYRRQLVGGGLMIAVLLALVVGLTANWVRRRSAEREVRALSRRLLTAFEDERRHLGRELHDDISQRLARLAIDVARIERDGIAPAGGVDLRSMREDIGSLAADIHALSRRLHPTVLDDLGLGEALRAEAERFSRCESQPVNLRLEEPDGALSSEVALCLYRVAQESLSNVSRHARGSRVEISLCSRDGGCRLEVRDDGAGFDTESRRGAGLGLASMRERMKLARGRLTVTSAPGLGTSVVAWAPFAGGPR